jgi:hypothetical protein
MEDNKNYVRLDLVGYIKDLLEKFNASFFDMITDEEDNTLKKWQRNEELTIDELLLLAEYKINHNFKKTFKDDILNQDSFVLFEDKRELITELFDKYNDLGRYLLYESYYVKKFLDEAPSKIRRALSLSNVFLNEEPSSKVMQYCKEAYSCYIDGQLNASVILLRAIIEQTLKEKFDIDPGTLEPTRKYLINNGLISDELSKKIIKIRDGGNKAVHNITRNRQTSESYNKYLIEIAQNILKVLFNS